MSGFFGIADQSESDESDDVEVQEVANVQARVGKVDFMIDDEESDDEGREIQTRKDKAHDKLTSLVDGMRNSASDQDFVKCLEQFDQFVKQEKKFKKDVKMYGFPENYIKNLARLRVCVDSEFKLNKKDKKYLHKHQSKALSKLAIQKISKLLLYDKEVKDYMREHAKELEELPVLSESDEDSDDSSNDESKSDDEGSDEESADEKKQKDSGDEDESGEEQADYFGSESDSWPAEDSDGDDEDEWSDEGDEINEGLLERMKSREFWVKKDIEGLFKTDEERQQANIKEREQRRIAQVVKDRKAQDKREKRRKRREKEMRDAEEQSKKWKNIKIKLKKILVERNRAGVDRMEIIDKLKDIATKLSKDPLYSNTLLTVNVILVNCLLDLSTNKLDGLKRDLWVEIIVHIKEVLRIMKEIPDGVSNKPLRMSQWVDLRITDDHDDPEDLDDDGLPTIRENPADDIIDMEAAHRDDIDVDEVRYSYVHGNLYAFLHRLRDQLALSLKNMNSNTTEYKDRLTDEDLLMEVLVSAQEYFRDFKDKTGEIDCALCRMSYLYTKYDPVRDNVGQTSPSPRLGRFGPNAILKLDTGLDLVQLSRLVFSYNSNDEHTRRIRAILTQFPPPKVINPSRDEEHAHIMASCKVADTWYSVPLIKVGIQGFKDQHRGQNNPELDHQVDVGCQYLSSGGEKDEFGLHQEDVANILLLDAMPANEEFEAHIRRYHGELEGFHKAAMAAVTQLKRDGATTFKFTVELDGTRFLKPNEPSVEQLLVEQNSSLYKLYSELCQALLKTKPKAAYGETRGLQACLYLVYNQALHNNFYVARDLLQMSQLTSSIYEAPQTNKRNWNSNAPKILQYDIKTTQVLFNRTIARLAISAFVNGEWSNCMKILQELYGTRKIKELLAQGSGYRMDKITDEQLAKETKRAVLPHLHMELEVLESCHLISAMFFEIPMIVNFPNDDFRRHTVSRSFRKIWDQYMQKCQEQFMGPPETVRDHVFRAGMEMKEGNWKRCFEYLKDLDFWDKLNGKEQATRLVERETKKQSLRCFLVMHGPQYCALSMKSLSDRFDMTHRDLHMWISSLIESKDDNLMASWDQCSNCLVVHSEPASRLQKALLSYTDKLHQLVEVNEQLAHVGGYNKGQRRGYNRNRTAMIQRAATRQSKGNKFGSAQQSRGGQNNRGGKAPPKPISAGRFGR